MFVAQYTERRRAQEQQPSVRGGQSQPSSGQHPEEVAVTEEDGSALDLAQPGDDTISPLTDRRDRLAPRATVSEQVPVRPLLADLGRRATVILAVVPFRQ